MDSAVVYIRRDDFIVGYPSVNKQAESASGYSKERGFMILGTFIDENGSVIDEAVMCCISNNINSIIMYNYKTLAHRSIDRVSVSKKLYQKNIKIHFVENI